MPCTAHVLKLIVSTMLKTLKVGNHNVALEACARIQGGEHIGEYSVLNLIRIIAVWIARTPQRKKEWKNDLPDKSNE